MQLVSCKNEQKYWNTAIKRSDRERPHHITRHHTRSPNQASTQLNIVYPTIQEIRRKRNWPPSRLRRHPRKRVAWARMMTRLRVGMRRTMDRLYTQITIVKRNMWSVLCSCCSIIKRKRSNQTRATEVKKPPCLSSATHQRSHHYTGSYSSIRLQSWHVPQTVQTVLRIRFRVATTERHDRHRWSRRASHV